MTILLLFSLFLTPGSQAAEVKVAAASDLQYALGDLAKAFAEKHPGEKIAATYGASGKFLTQIKEGAPFDLFLAADTESPKALESSGHAASAVFAYALGHLALWKKNDSPISLDGDLACLLDPQIKHIAMANPAHAPYGRAAEEALRRAKLEKRLHPKLVVGENVAQAAQFVLSGAAEVGLVAKSLTLSPALRGAGRAVDVNEKIYAPLRQSGVVLKGPRAESAAKFRDFLLSSDGKAVLRRYGLGAL